MGEGIHGVDDPTERSRDSHMGSKKDQHNGRPGEADEAIKSKEKFESAYTDPVGDNAATSVAHYAMANAGSLEHEPWDEENPETEIQNWIQEELYIHSKLLIADDRIVVCGSSNLNDRSQLGYHDSELSIVMEDTKRIQSTMDGQPFEAGWHAASLRRYLWREHLGLLPPQDLDGSKDPNAQPPGDDSPNDAWDQHESWSFVEDPLNDKVWDMWTANASKNTELFRHLFHADPDDHSKGPPFISPPFDPLSPCFFFLFFLACLENLLT
jgi:phospholipase D1/2